MRASIWVSPQGANNNLGTKNAPLKSIEAALQRVRGRASEYVIRLAPGDYPLAHGISLGPEFSGLTFEGGNRARLTGGPSISEWKPLTDVRTLRRLSPAAQRNVLEACLPRGYEPCSWGPLGFAVQMPLMPGELFAENRTLQLARYPNHGWLRTESVSGPRSFSFPDSRPRGWVPDSDIRVSGYWANDWSMTLTGFRQLRPFGKEIELSSDTPFGLIPNRRFFFLNVLEELDSPGEYYVDRVRRKIYLWPNLGANQYLFSTLAEPLIAVHDASDITLRGLSLEGGRNSGLYITHSKGISVQSCEVRNFGDFGAYFDDCENSGISETTISGIGFAAVALYGGDRLTLKPGNLYARDCDISNFARWSRTYQPGIAIQGVGNEVRNCSIHDSPHSAILLSGNDHQIAYNDIQRVCQEVGDAGAVYTGRDVTQRGTVIRFNRFRNIVPTESGHGLVSDVSSVYLDDFYAGTSVIGNIFEGPGTGILLGGGQDNTIAGNLFVGKDVAIHVDARGQGWGSGMLSRNPAAEIYQGIARVHANQPPYSTHYPALAKILDVDLARPTGNRITGNVAFGGWMQLLDGLSQKDFAFEENQSYGVKSFTSAWKHRPLTLGRFSTNQIGPRRRSSFNPCRGKCKDRSVTDTLTR